MKIEVFVFLLCCLWGTIPFVVMFSYANLYSMGMVISGYVISNDNTIKHYLEKLPEINLSATGEIANHILIFALAPVPLAKKLSIARCVFDFRISTILCLIAGNAVHTYYIVILGIGFLRFAKKIRKFLRKFGD